MVPSSARIRVSLGVLGIALGAVLTLLVALPSCRKLPEKTCRGEQVNALTLDAGGPDPACTTCLQQRCCDAVGYCTEDPTCTATFNSAHACVLEAGPAGESECINRLGASTERSRQLYDCMRANCGGNDRGEAACGVSNCNVDPAVVLLSSARCDRCLGGSCCREINGCYGDRRCKLAIECIVRDCGTLGVGMTRLGASGPENIDRLRQFVCGAAAPDAALPEDLSGISDSCILDCLGTFAPAGGTADDVSARCLAFDVYACGATAGCGASCAEGADDDGVDAGDAPPDAATD